MSECSGRKRLGGGKKRERRRGGGKKRRRGGREGFGMIEGLILGVDSFKDAGRLAAGRKVYGRDELDLDIPSHRNES